MNEVFRCDASTFCLHKPGFWSPKIAQCKLVWRYQCPARLCTSTRPSKRLLLCLLHHPAGEYDVFGAVECLLMVSSHTFTLLEVTHPPTTIMPELLMHTVKARGGQFRPERSPTSHLAVAPCCSRFQYLCMA